MSETGSALPPPPPPDPRSARWNAIWPFLAVVGIGVATVMTVLWWGERNELNSTTSNLEDGPDIVAELDSVRRELGETRASLADAEAEIERLTDENARLTVEPAATGPTDDAADADADEGTGPDADDSAGDLGTSSEMPDEDASTSEAADLVGADESSTPDAISGLTPLEIGTELGGLYRRNVLGVGQRRCLGDTVASTLGPELDEIMAASDPGLDDRLVGALLEAVAECGIDSTAVFG